MTTGERKQLLFQRLMAVNDERLLEDIEALLNNRCPDNVLYFSSELRDKIDNALEQMQCKEVVSTEEMEYRLRWNKSEDLPESRMDRSGTSGNERNL